MRVKIYVEGGGDNEPLLTECRKGFRLFFENAGLTKRTLTVVASGSRQSAFDDFSHAHRQAQGDEFIVLLVDSEERVEEDPNSKEPVNVWTHLSKRDGWNKPVGATDEQAHLMAQVMETWFLADPDCLKRYFGKDFKSNKLVVHPDLEGVPKDTVNRELADATSDLGRNKPKYEKRTKGRYSFEILGRIDPVKVRLACTHADSLLKTLDRKSSRR